jgi:hypothetical protein
LDGTSHEITHKIYLDLNPSMFSCVLRPGYPKGIAIRLSGDDWSLQDKGTLHAFKEREEIHSLLAGSRLRRYLRIHKTSLHL